ncbi:hypothetical protein MUP00_05980 [Candidatus Bathyarchaeota archaeon]|nr:hypothetical protein [Candidatus Bathyarchaeota archaeon]
MGMEIIVEDSPRLIKRFSGDEEVAYDFEEAGYLAKTRDRDTDYPQILVAPDRMGDNASEDQVVISVARAGRQRSGLVRNTGRSRRTTDQCS